MPKGIPKSGINKGWFKKGICPKTAIKKGEHRATKTEFQKRHIPWNKGKSHLKGSKHPLWKGGRHPNTQGYIIVHKPNHPFCEIHGYIREHRLVMEKIIGRYLTPEERVHHKGIKYPIGSIENKQDNRPKNLQLFVNESEHESNIPHRYKKFVYKGRKTEYWKEHSRKRRLRKNPPPLHQYKNYW